MELVYLWVEEWLQKANNNLNSALKLLEDSDLVMDKELKKFIYEKCFFLQKHLTYEEYLKKNPSLEEKTKNILKECGTVKYSPENTYVIEEGATILFFFPFDYERHIYGVNAIYTDKDSRNQGSARRLLESLDFFGSLYFSTYTPALIELLKSLEAKEEDIIENKPESQFILDISRIPSIRLINNVIKVMNEEENFDN